MESWATGVDNPGCHAVVVEVAAVGVWVVDGVGAVN